MVCLSARRTLQRQLRFNCQWCQHLGPFRQYLHPKVLAYTPAGPAAVSYRPLASSSHSPPAGHARCPFRPGSSERLAKIGVGKQATFKRSLRQCSVLFSNIPPITPMNTARSTLSRLGSQFITAHSRTLIVLRLHAADEIHAHESMVTPNARVFLTFPTSRRWLGALSGPYLYADHGDLSRDFPGWFQPLSTDLPCRGTPHSSQVRAWALRLCCGRCFQPTYPPKNPGYMLPSCALAAARPIAVSNLHMLRRQRMHSNAVIRLFKALFVQSHHGAAGTASTADT